MRYTITPAGQRRLLKRLSDLRARYDAVCATNGEAAEAGDNSVWHDNFAYEENQRQMHALARAVRDLEQHLRHTAVVAVPQRTERAVLGTVVTLADQHGECHRFVLAGHQDGEPDLGRISVTAPLGRLLVGKGPGDVIEWQRANTQLELEVLAIAPDPEEAA